MDKQNYYAADSRTRWQRLMSWMFPVRQLPVPDDLDGWAPNYWHSHVVSTLDWRDRLRVLVSGKVHAHTITKTDVSVSEMHSESVVYVEAP